MDSGGTTCDSPSTTVGWVDVVRGSAPTPIHHTVSGKRGICLSKSKLWPEEDATGHRARAIDLANLVQDPAGAAKRDCALQRRAQGQPRCYTQRRANPGARCDPEERGVPGTGHAKAAREHSTQLDTGAPLELEVSDRR